MGYHGLPSKACSSCRTRRIKCDLARPACGQCVRGRRTCSGYRDAADLLFHDLSEEVARKVSRHQPKRTPPEAAMTAAPIGASHSTRVLSPTSWSRPITPESQALCFFFRNHPALSSSRNFRTMYDVIPAVYCSATPGDGPLLCILTALGLAGLSHHTETAGMEVAARAWYDRALRKVNRDLRDGHRVKLDETILAVLLLGLYETNTCNTPRSMRSWLAHAKGATALLDLRGEEQLDSELGRSLFVQARIHVVTGCYQTRSPIPDTIIRLSRACRRRFTSPAAVDPAEDLNAIVTEFCNARSAIPFRPPMTQSESTTRAAIAQYTSIAEALADWYDALPATFHPSTVYCDDMANPDILSDHYDVYLDMWTTNLANNYRANAILIHEALLSQLDFLRVQYGHDDHLDDQLKQSRSTILSVIDTICASVPGLLRTNVAAAGVGLLWPLYVAAQLSPRTVRVPDATRTWMIGRLEKIGTELGVRQATMLVKLLYKDTDVSELFKDEERVLAGLQDG